MTEATESGNKGFFTSEDYMKAADEARRRERRTWQHRDGLYHCGNCGRVPFYIDIAERTICYNCETVMEWYEDEKENGYFYPVKFHYDKNDEPYGFIWDSFLSPLTR